MLRTNLVIKTGYSYILNIDNYILYCMSLVRWCIGHMIATWFFWLMVNANVGICEYHLPNRCYGYVFCCLFSR